MALEPSRRRPVHLIAAEELGFTSIEALQVGARSKIAARSRAQSWALLAQAEVVGCAARPQCKLA